MLNRGRTLVKNNIDDTSIGDKGSETVKFSGYGSEYISKRREPQESYRGYKSYKETSVAVILGIKIIAVISGIILMIVIGGGLLIGLGATLSYISSLSLPENTSKYLADIGKDNNTYIEDSSDDYQGNSYIQDINEQNYQDNSYTQDTYDEDYQDNSYVEDTYEEEYNTVDSDEVVHPQFGSCPEMRSVKGYENGVYEGHPDYMRKLDRDGDGRACERDSE